MMALALDIVILIMVNLFIIKLINRQPIGMFTGIYRLEKTKFVFTGRTEVRLGG
jgi:hypothetical protein